MSMSSRFLVLLLILVASNVAQAQILSVVFDGKFRQGGYTRLANGELKDRMTFAGLDGRFTISVDLDSFEYKNDWVDTWGTRHSELSGAPRIRMEVNAGGLQVSSAWMDRPGPAACNGDITYANTLTFKYRPTHYMHAVSLVGDCLLRPEPDTGSVHLYAVSAEPWLASEVIGAPMFSASLFPISYANFYFYNNFAHRNGYMWAGERVEGYFEMTFAHAYIDQGQVDVDEPESVFLIFGALLGVFVVKRKPKYRS